VIEREIPQNAPMKSWPRLSARATRAPSRIGMRGSVSVVRQLLAAGLLDELHLLVHPIAVRKGMRLFDEGEPRNPPHTDLVADLRDRCAEPGLRPGRVGRQRQL